MIELLSGAQVESQYILGQSDLGYTLALVLNIMTEVITIANSCRKFTYIRLFFCANYSRKETIQLFENYGILFGSKVHKLYSFLAGFERNQMYRECCSAQMAHKLV